MGFRTRLLEIPFAYDWLQSGIYRAGSKLWLTESVIQPMKGLRILDVGCGTSAILSTLPSVDYLGIDHNPKYIEKARLIHGDRGIFRMIDVNDAQFQELGKFDRVLLLGVLHHLDDSECKSLLAALQAVLKPDGFLVTFDNAFVDGQHPIARLLVKLDRGRFARAPNEYRVLIEGEFDIRSEIVRQDLCRVPYTHVIFQAVARGL